jgi:hypothetical protein
MQGFFMETRSRIHRLSPFVGVAFRSGCPFVIQAIRMKRKKAEKKTTAVTFFFIFAA